MILGFTIVFDHFASFLIARSEGPRHKPFLAVTVLRRTTTRCWAFRTRGPLVSCTRPSWAC
jgi:hypothetical protein